jgi:hypothetical protein
MAAVTHAQAYDDALAREIAEAQAELNTAIDRAGLRNDAYGAVLRAQSAHLTAMHNILTAFQRDLVSAQPAFTDANMRQLGTQLSPSLHQFANTARIKTYFLPELPRWWWSAPGAGSRAVPRAIRKWSPSVMGSVQPSPPHPPRSA